MERLTALLVLSLILPGFCHKPQDYGFTRTSDGLYTKPVTIDGHKYTLTMKITHGQAYFKCMDNDNNVHFGEIKPQGFVFDDLYPKSGWEAPNSMGDLPAQKPSYSHHVPSSTNMEDNIPTAAVRPQNLGQYPTPPPAGYPIVGSPGLNTENAQHYPAPPTAYPAPPMGYDEPPTAYPAPPMGYDEPPTAYPAPPMGYDEPPTAYPAPPMGYDEPPTAYPAPPMGYHEPPTAYPAPPPGYHEPPTAYPAPPPGYHETPTAYPAPPQGYSAPPPGYNAPPPGYPAVPDGPSVPGGPGVPNYQDLPDFYPSQQANFGTNQYMSNIFVDKRKCNGNFYELSQEIDNSKGRCLEKYTVMGKERKSTQNIYEEFYPNKCLPVTTQRLQCSGVFMGIVGMSYLFVYGHRDLGNRLMVIQNGKCIVKTYLDTTVRSQGTRKELCDSIINLLSQYPSIISKIAGSVLNLAKQIVNFPVGIPTFTDKRPNPKYQSATYPNVYAQTSPPRPQNNDGFIIWFMRRIFRGL